MMASAAVRGRIKLSWLDLRGSGLSAIERLCLEEALLRHDPHERSWAILGNHEPTRNRYLQHTALPSHVASSKDPNTSCLIVMGIGGKPKDLLNMDLVRNDGVLVIKRFSGGGTVVLDHSSVWTSFIGRTKDFEDVEPYPRSIMQWSADNVFGPAFSKMKQESKMSEENNAASSTRRSLVVDSKSCGMDYSGRTIAVPTRDDISEAPTEIPDFSLRENDYVLGERKMGGNAQSIVKGAWLHHTSFLWDYVDGHMEYLSLPSKRPEYRGDRSHEDFLVKLNTYHGHLGIPSLFASVKEACSERFNVEEVTLQEALEVVNNELGGMQNWFDGKCRTRLIDLDSN